MELLEYKGRKKALMRTALVLAIIAAALNIVCMPYFSIPLAFLSLTFVFLSKGYELKLEQIQIAALATALFAIILSGSTIAMTLKSFYTNDEYRKEIYELYNTLYGDSYEELYGEDFSEYMEKFFSGKE